MSPVDLEKTNLEMHVELQAMRDQVARDELADIREKIQDLLDTIREFKQTVDEMKDARNTQLINWGTAIIISLISALGVILLRIIMPAFLSKQ